MNKEFNEYLINYWKERSDDNYLILFEEEITKIKKFINVQKIPERLNNFLDIDDELMKVFIETFLDKKNINIENNFIIVPNNYARLLITYLNENTPKEVIDLFKSNFQNKLTIIDSWVPTEKQGQ